LPHLAGGYISPLLNSHNPYTDITTKLTKKDEKPSRPNQRNASIL